MAWYSILLFFIWFPLFAYPTRDARGNFTENFTHLQVKFFISMERLSYKEGEDIPLEFHVQNFGKEVVRIFPATDYRSTFQLQIRDQNNRLVPLRLNPVESNPRYSRDPIQKARNHIENLKGDESKEIALAPGEKFSFRIILQEEYDIYPSNTYTLVGYFYPNPTESLKNQYLGGNFSEGRLAFLRSENTLRFEYEPRRKIQEFSGIPEGNIEFGEGISPEETIFLFLGAERKKKWENYFKWLFIPDFILAYDKYSAVYVHAGDQEKEFIEEEFKKYLTTLPSGILKYFKITGVDKIHENEARVRVFAERVRERIPTRYEYEYVLRKNPYEPYSYWKIHGVTARVRR